MTQKLHDGIYEWARRTFLRDTSTSQSHDRYLGASSSALIGFSASEERFDEQGYLGDAVCTIGAFDGVHRGHRYLFSATIRDARSRNLPSVIVTFDPDPDELFLPPARIHKLLNNQDRIQYLRKFGADYVLCLPFTKKLAAHTTEAFLKNYIFSVFRPRAIHVGTDFKLGANNHGNVAELRKISASHKNLWDVFSYDLLCSMSKPVSSTRIRTLLMNDGDCEGAEELLMRSHFVTGRVCEGRHKGSAFGFPTANVSLSYPYVVPKEGVYAALVLIDNLVLPAAVNVGIPKTFADEPGCASMEAYLLDYSGDLYDREISVAFIRRLRDQQCFSDVSELQAAVGDNIAWVRDNLASKGFSI